VQVPIVFEPTQTGDVQAELTLTTDLDDGAVIIPLQGVAAQARSMQMMLPSAMRIFPGHVVNIPVMVNSGAVSKSSRCSLELVYDTTIMKYLDYENIGTASSSGEVTAHESQDALHLQVNMPTTFYAKDTLVHVRFATRLGLSDRTSFSVRSARFGDGACDALFPVGLPTTEVQLDSLCGLRDKLPTGPVTRFMIHPLAPNPSTQSVVVRYSVPTEGHTILSLHSLVGESIIVLVDAFHTAGDYTVTIPTADLRNGVYLIQLSSGMFQEGLQLVVAH
jgi:hypothetical protein